MRRDVQLSFVDGLDRPVGPIPASVQTGTNADLIARVAPLYLTGSVLDVTYGLGGWWQRFTPDPFTYHDLHTVDGVDFRDLPHDDGSFDAVCFDPPYVPQGSIQSQTSNSGDFRSRYGLTVESQPWTDLFELMRGGIAECARVARRWVLVKCGDFVTGGTFRLGHLEMLNTGIELGLDVHDVIVHHAGSGPGGHNIVDIKRARRHHSYLLVFAKGGGR